MDWTNIIGLLQTFFSSGWIAPLLTFLVGWLALPVPSSISSSWWGQLLASLFGNNIALQNIQQIIGIVIAILQQTHVIPANSPAPDAAMISRVIRGKMSIADAVKNHQAVVDSVKN